MFPYFFYDVRLYKKRLADFFLNIQKIFNYLPGDEIGEAGFAAI